MKLTSNKTYDEIEVNEINSEIINYYSSSDRNDYLNNELREPRSMYVDYDKFYAKYNSNDKFNEDNDVIEIDVGTINEKVIDFYYTSECNDRKRRKIVSGFEIMENNVIDKNNTKKRKCSDEFISKNDLKQDVDSNVKKAKICDLKVEMEEKDNDTISESFIYEVKEIQQEKTNKPKRNLYERVCKKKFINERIVDEKECISNTKNNIVINDEERNKNVKEFNTENYDKYIDKETELNKLLLNKEENMHEDKNNVDKITNTKKKVKSKNIKVKEKKSYKSKVIKKNKLKNYNNKEKINETSLEVNNLVTNKLNKIDETILELDKIEKNLQSKLFEEKPASIKRSYGRKTKQTAETTSITKRKNNKNKIISLDLENNKISPEQQHLEFSISNNLHLEKLNDNHIIPVDTINGTTSIKLKISKSDIQDEILNTHNENLDSIKIKEIDFTKNTDLNVTKDKKIISTKNKKINSTKAKKSASIKLKSLDNSKTKSSSSTKSKSTDNSKTISFDKSQSKSSNSTNSKSSDISYTKSIDKSKAKSSNSTNSKSSDISNAKSIDSINLENSNLQDSFNKNGLLDNQTIEKILYNSEFESANSKRLEELSKDKRYLLFLKKTKPNLYKNFNSPLEFIKYNEEILYNKSIINKATLLDPEYRINNIKDSDNINDNFIDTYTNISDNGDMNSYINQIEDNNKINIKTENDLNKIINEDNILDTNTIYNITNTNNIDTNKEYNNINTTKTPKLMIEETTIKDDFNSVKFVGDELKEFKKLVLKFKNNLDCIHSNMKNRSMQDIVYNYYLNKNKTHNYIKKKNRRISDKEMNLIIDKEWTQEEKDIFHLKYPIFGKNVSKYQKFILKSIKDLRIYLLCYLKKIKKPEAKKFNKKDWSKDEQQLFAVFYSYYNKKWGNMVEHFPNKNKEDLKMYFNKYFKLLSVEEQRFETSLREYKLESRTDPVLHVKNKDRDYEYLELVGLLKRSVM